MRSGKIIAVCVLLSLALGGCSQEEAYAGNGSESSALPEASSEASSAESSESLSDGQNSSVPEKTIAVTAEVISYKDGVLSFEHEGREYSLPFDRDSFDNETYLPDERGPRLSEMVINNKLGEKVQAKLAMNEEMTKIKKCDVINTNGSLYEGMTPIMNDYTVNEDMLYKLTRKEKSLCVISNKHEAFECDLNDLPLLWKIDYPEEVFPVLPDFYRFKDGKVFLYNLGLNIEVTESRVGGEMNLDTFDMYGRRTGFFAAVMSVNDDSINVLLNDGKTLCTVPSWYNDGGELKTGAQIMVMLSSDSSLFGAGGEHSFEYAAISTDPDYFKRSTDKFEDIAYAVFNGWDSFEYTTVDEADKS